MLPISTGAFAGRLELSGLIILALILSRLATQPAANITDDHHDGTNDGERNEGKHEFGSRSIALAARR
ncbi:hypothetical protein [Ectopseudomonas khazarica]|uniref:hypothetical protein n=1 Tax=Ectopseudomonas khazarica TaxID=2502979 RepID=UPI002FE07012